MNSTCLNLVGAGKVCTLEIDEAKISGEGYEFPTLTFKAKLSCPKPDRGKITIMSIYGYLEMKTSTSKLLNSLQI